MPDAATDTRRLSLRVLIFMLCTGLVVLVVVASVAASIFQGRSVADLAVDEALARSHASQDFFQQQRGRQLTLITDLMAGDADLRKYFSQALGGDDLFDEGVSDEGLGSIDDLLEERRQDIGFDVVMFLDPDGYLLTHSLRTVGVDETVDDHPLVAELIEDLVPLSGLWEESGELYQAAMVPLTEGGFNLIGFLIAGLRVDAALIDGVKQASGAELIIYSPDGVYASTLAARETDDLMRQLGSEADLIETIMGNAGVPMTREIQLAGRPWVASLRPFDAQSEVPAIAVSLISQDAVLAGYRSLQRTMILVGLFMIAVGLLGSLWLSRRVTLPLRRFAQVATAASEGDYDQHFISTGKDEIGRLGRAFETLMSDLRERRDMEEFVTDLSRYIPEGGEGSAVRTETTSHQPPVHRDVALLGLDFRAIASAAGDARAHIQELEQRVSGVELCAARCGGQVEALVGHRLVLGFDGDDAAFEALACAGEIARAENPLPPMGLVSGEADRGSVRTTRLRTGVVIGKPSQQLDLLLEEARPGQLLMSPTIKEVLAEALDDPKPSVVSGRISGRRYYSLGPGALSSLPGVDAEIEDPAASVVSVAEGGARAGDVFADRYEIVSLLGAGGMGMVYRAVDRELDDVVALKTLLPEVASDTRYLDSLKEELILARRITHPNVLRTFDFGSYNGIAYISMEYVRGMTLRYLLGQRPQLPYSAGLRIARQLAAGLSAAHEQGVIHRDIKPENLIIEAAGNAKLMDFGIARPVAKLAMDEAQNVFVGTPRYASPEQMEGKPVKPAADVFACGVLMYEMFTGFAPFAGSDLMEIYRAKRDGGVPHPSDIWPECPPELESIIMNCLSSDEDDRFASGESLGKALNRLRA